MRLSFAPGLLALAGILGCTRLPATGPLPATPQQLTNIMLVACPHLSQLRKADKPTSDVLTPPRQAELEALLSRLQRFRPDVITVEELPEEQARIDSLYALYRQDKLNLSTLPGGRSEVYQLGFALGKRLGLARIYCVNSEGGTSQSILHEGQNIKLYEEATAAHRAYYAPVVQQWESGAVSMSGLLYFLNSRPMLEQLHTLVYRTPARVTDGTLKTDPMVDASFVKPHYVGAEFISVLYNRDLKIYSNIVTTQLATGGTRLLTIIGGRHVASLQGILRTDPAYRVVPATTYLKKK
ncbi:hypothetical protein HNQ93_001008 [Hymenobacter luteus]|uniref:Uncharacterized protein n=2 Tax=Hymenobacter TaxID=89966 RepID=A0A7W9WAQ1_9BACT|nr:MULTISPECIES: DUF5694 domain-containing protein [Hymenobacter]MBB4599512.1 hypothetical protein [Hymenobacter latericoloratus]MBB6058178.1 hypothetical protein [Hymenobacter luteus]